ncbi:MAG TPA: hypothetical protein DCP53_02340, partial [Elusimicrobia bacterium]|nr:hypothetical protein [Elusimicrobiota bacterium]
MAEGKVNNVGGNVNGSYILRTCPRRNENVLATQDSTGKLAVQIWNGSSWGTVQTFSIDVTTRCRAFDVAYEQTSGNAIVAYRKNSYLNRIYYSVWNGISWSESTDSGLDLDGDAINWVRLEPNPNSNELVLVTMCISSHVYAAVWNGSTWANQQALETVGTNSAFQQGFDVVYTSSYNYAMIAWNEDGDNKIQYRQWFSTASAWGNEATIPATEITTGNDEGYRWIKLAANPLSTSNEILIGCYDTEYDINMAVWDGSIWDDGNAINYNATTGISYEYRCFDVSYERSSGRGIVGYASASKPYKARYVFWSGASWGTGAATQYNIKSQPRYVTLYRDKDQTSNELMLTTDDVDNDINIQRWTGTVWNLLSEVEKASYYNKECYAISYSFPGSQYDSVPPANISN